MSMNWWMNGMYSRYDLYDLLENVGGEEQSQPVRARKFQNNSLLHTLFDLYRGES